MHLVFVRWLDPTGRPVSTFIERYKIINDTFYIYNIIPNDKGVWTCEASAGDIVVTAKAEIMDVYGKTWQKRFYFIYSENAPF